MQQGLSSQRERERMDAVRRYDVLDTPPDGAFERVTALAARLFDVPISIVSVVDADRIWFKSHHGIDAEQTGRDSGLCASAILQDAPWLVADASIDPRTMANPLVAGELGLRFYAGAPLRTHDGYNLGTLCVIDKAPRVLTAREVVLLQELAGVVMDELELRRSAMASVRREAELRERAEAVAWSLQESLLPPSLPVLDGVDLASRYHVAFQDQVGGDFYDVITTSWGSAIVSGDACGKGTLAAALAGRARWTLHAVLSAEPDPAVALTRLNEVLAADEVVARQYLTAAVAALRPRAGALEVTVAIGGHPHPLVARRDGRIESIGTTGPIVGWSSGSSYVGASRVLEPGDALVMFTDGLIEALAGRGETGDLAVRDVLASLAGHGAPEIADGLDTAMADQRRDDAAFVVACVR